MRKAIQVFDTGILFSAKLTLVKSILYKHKDINN